MSELKAKIHFTATCKTAEIVGQDIGNKLRNKGIKKIVFDRGNKIYHGKNKSSCRSSKA